MKPFDEIVVEHGPAVLRACRATLGPHEAEDAWAETFLAALRAYPRLRPDSNVRAWLMTIAHSKAVDQHRARTRNPLPVEELPVTTPLDRDPRESLLWTALGELPDKQRHAVVYHHIAGLTYAEIAEILGNSETAARRAGADGVKSLRAIYKEMEGAAP